MKLNTLSVLIGDAIATGLGETDVSNCEGLIIEGEGDARTVKIDIKRRLFQKKDKEPAATSDDPTFPDDLKPESGASAVRETKRLAELNKKRAAMAKVSARFR